MRLGEHPDVRGLVLRGAGLLLLLAVDAGLTVWAAARDLRELEAAALAPDEWPDLEDAPSGPPDAQPCRPCREAAAAGQPVPCRCVETLLRRAAPGAAAVTAALRMGNA